MKLSTTFRLLIFLTFPYWGTCQPKITGDIHFLGAIYSNRLENNEFKNREGSALLNIATNLNSTWRLKNSPNESVTIKIGFGVQPMLLIANVLLSEFGDETYNPLFIEHSFQYDKQFKKQSFFAAYNGILMNAKAIELKNNYLPGVSVGSTFKLLQDMTCSIYLNGYYNKLVPYKIGFISDKAILIGPGFSVHHFFKNRKVRSI